jgi:WD40 repeat protein
VIQNEPETVQEKAEDYDFIVSGAVAHGSDSPEVKVWRVRSDRVDHIHSLTTGHSLGIVSVDVSPNGKCKLFNLF